MSKNSNKLMRGNDITRGKLLDAAERCFARQGYWGTSVREIVSEGQVQLGLLNHYFGGKEELFRQVVNRRAREHASAMSEGLDRLLEQKTSPTVEDLIRACVEPLLILSQTGGEGWKNYAQLIGRVMPGRQYEKFLEPIADVYDGVVSRFIDEIRKTFVIADERRLFLSFYFLQCSFFCILLEPNLLERQSGALCKSEALDDILDELIPFFGAAFRVRIGAPIS